MNILYPRRSVVGLFEGLIILGLLAPFGCDSAWTESLEVPDGQVHRLSGNHVFDSVSVGGELILDGDTIVKTAGNFTVSGGGRVHCDNNGADGRDVDAIPGDGQPGSAAGVGQPGRDGYNLTLDIGGDLSLGGPISVSGGFGGDGGKGGQGGSVCPEQACSPGNGGDGGSGGKGGNGGSLTVLVQKGRLNKLSGGRLEASGGLGGDGGRAGPVGAGVGFPNPGRAGEAGRGGDGGKILVYAKDIMAATSGTALIWTNGGRGGKGADGEDGGSHVEGGRGTLASLGTHGGQGGNAGAVLMHLACTANAININNGAGYGGDGGQPGQSGYSVYLINDPQIPEDDIYFDPHNAMSGANGGNAGQPGTVSIVAKEIGLLKVLGSGGNGGQGGDATAIAPGATAPPFAGCGPGIYGANAIGGNGGAGSNGGRATVKSNLLDQVEAEFTAGLGGPGGKGSIRYTSDCERQDGPTGLSGPSGQDGEILTTLVKKNSLIATLETNGSLIPPNQEFTYLLSVSTPEISQTDVEVQLTLPKQVKLVRVVGEKVRKTNKKRRVLSWKIKRLKACESKTYQVIAKVDPLAGPQSVSTKAKARSKKHSWVNAEAIIEIIAPAN